jgi:hypothetical protein
MVGGDGRRVPLTMVSDPTFKFVHGFDVRDTYGILLPGQGLDFYRDLKYFYFKPGRYKFQIFVFYYVCDDIVDLERPAPKRDIPMFRVTGSGQFAVGRK